MATYGEGEATDNAQRFVKWLTNENDEVSNDYLNQTKYCVFGLGNKQYEHFNRTGKLTNAGLNKLGAIPVYQYGEGDDDGSLEEDFDKWKSELWNSLGGTKSEGNTEEKVSLYFALKVVGTVDPSSTTQNGKESFNQALSSKKISNKVPASLKHFFTSPNAEITVNRELRNQHFTGFQSSSDQEAGIGSTRHIEINLEQTGIQYLTADNLAILPENPSNYVEALAQRLGYNLNELIDFEEIPGKEDDYKLIYPSPCSVRELLTSYADILGPVRHVTLQSLLPYVQNIEEKQWVKNLIVPEHRLLFKETIEEQHESLYTLLLTKLPSSQIPLVDFLHLVSNIQPRYYTISSSSSWYPTSVHITVSVTEHKNHHTGEKFLGLCSGYLQSLLPNQSTCRIFVRPSTFRLPKSLASPVILVGPGTGIAPMRALLQERQYLIEHMDASSSSSKTKQVHTEVGKCALFFGCKYSQMDFLYEDEIMNWKITNILTDLHTAFSRETNQKVYVQHLMLNNPAVGEELVHLLIDKGGSFFVCGATSMGNDVHHAIIQLISTYKKISIEEATTMVKRLQEKNRYVQELWTA
jgi:NADPH-ferrihemoprotein reductase